VAYTYDEELVASTEPQEPMEFPMQEQAPVQANKDEKEEASALSPKTTESTPPVQSPKMQEAQMETPEHSGSTGDKGKLDVLIDTTINIIEGNKLETMPLVGTTRGTLEESNVATPEEDKKEIEPKAPTTTQEPVEGPLGE
jgi:hypothetical protein